MRSAAYSASTLIRYFVVAMVLGLVLYYFRPVFQWEMYGTYEASYMKWGESSLELKRDFSYVQTIHTHEGRDIINRGSWEVARGAYLGKRITIYGYLDIGGKRPALDEHRIGSFSVDPLGRHIAIWVDSGQELAYTK